jgi:hypothetical protein
MSQYGQPTSESLYNIAVEQRAREEPVGVQEGWLSKDSVLSRKEGQAALVPDNINYGDGCSRSCSVISKGFATVS